MKLYNEHNPVLELDDGSTLSESIAICRYLQELHPTPALFGQDAWQRAQVEMGMRRIEFALLSRIGAVWVNTHKYTAHLGGWHARVSARPSAAA
jgi:glutathione S-transferase